MATLSLVILYYSSAKLVADGIADRTDIAVAYDTIVTDREKTEQYLTKRKINQRKKNIKLYKVIP